MEACPSFGSNSGHIANSPLLPSCWLPGVCLVLSSLCGVLLVKRKSVNREPGSSYHRLTDSHLFFFFNLFLGQRETEHERGRGRERGRRRIGNRLQAPSHQPRAWRGARTPGPRDRDLAEVGRLTDCATQAPPDSHLYTVSRCPTNCRYGELAEGERCWPLPVFPKSHLYSFTAWTWVISVQLSRSISSW